MNPSHDATHESHDALASLHTALLRVDGVGRRRDFTALGVNDRALAEAVAHGTLIRVRQGTYAARAVPPAIVAAVRVGGVLAGPAATPILGLWLPPRAPLGVSLRSHATRPRDPSRPDRLLDRRRTDVVVRYDGDRLDPVAERLHVGVTRCVIQCLPMLEPAQALAVLDSSLRLGAGSRPLIADVRAESPGRLHRLIAAADPRAEAGTESVLRWHLLRAGIRFEVQKWVADGIRVDFLVEGRLVVECTSYEFHGSPAAYRLDRARIAAIVALGHPVLELSYDLVLFDWPRVEAAIVAGVAGRRGREMRVR